VNCTGSCSWKIYVKSGIVTFETQQTDYPRTRPDMPNHEPRGCPRGASASWYLYHSGRIKFPMIRRPLLELWREARKSLAPVDAWKQIAGDSSYKNSRGKGGFVRSSWDEVNELIAAANVHTIEEYGPDRVVGFAPIPAYSMVSYAPCRRVPSVSAGAKRVSGTWKRRTVGMAVRCICGSA
jgi:nitrate reductase alpha subunit